MKKNLLMSALLLASATGFSQVKIAPEIGLNMYNQKAKYSMGSTSIESNSDFQPGARVGVIVDIPVTENFIVQPGLFYNLNRTKYETEDIMGTSATMTTRRTIHEIQLPIYALYKSGQDGYGRFFAGVGPYFGMALAGKDKTEATGGGVSATTEEDLSFGDDPKNDDMKPFTIGGSVTAGYELPLGLYFRANYNLGLSNNAPGGNEDVSLKSSSFGVSVGYYIR